jgi:hypothetical protein
MKYKMVIDKLSGAASLQNKVKITAPVSYQGPPLPISFTSLLDTSLKLVLIQHTKFVGFSYNVLVHSTDSRVLRFSCYKPRIL